MQKMRRDRAFVDVNGKIEVAISTLLTDSSGASLSYFAAHFQKVEEFSGFFCLDSKIVRHTTLGLGPLTLYIPGI